MTTTSNNGIPLWSSFRKRTLELWNECTTQEISGSLGDLGTFIPLTIALARDRLIYFAPALFFSGLSNLLTGYAWDVPMCVQPMKSIAAVALNGELTLEEVTTAGILTGGLIFVIGMTGLIEVVNLIIPHMVVSGMQIGLGLKLAGKGMKDIQKLSWVDSPDCILLAVACSLLALYWLRESSSLSPSSPSKTNDDVDIDDSAEHKSHSLMDRILCRASQNSSEKKTPVGVYLFLVGVIFAIVELATTRNENGQYDLPLRFFGAPIAVLALEDVGVNDWKAGFLDGALPQIPLTTLNSVISVCALAHSLYPEKRIHTSTNNSIRDSDAVVTRKEVAISVGVMNILCCPFGGIPNCHGAGGLAGQHCFGARGGMSVAFLGVCKMMLAVFFGASALTLLDAVPISVLSVMIIIAGQELATTGFTLLVKSGNASTLRSDTVVALVTAAVILALQKTHYGAIAGWVTFMVYGNGIEQFWAWMQRRRNTKTNEAVDDKGMTMCSVDAHKQTDDAHDTSSDLISTC
eukprot:CAMPEP_0116018986 /NCGR_PEP_ID=MMETSP0321-20121206/8965_1 /TAXON_ID=163516 /ORGANISM="Leptocylindrus danicus var. danicus, Strain B650" /LENGTH=518 /DNA_ID=CAMNT_0003489465 /DNA_START=62 /DNA_END=1619 /DNA_ORIENTATION=-